MKYLSISTRESSEIVVYPDSDKYLVRATWPGHGEADRFEQIQGRTGGLEYWDGEP